MDSHTYDLLEFGKVRGLLAEYANTSMGSELAQQVEPLPGAERIRAHIKLVTEMSDALGQGHTPPFGGVHDIRMLVKRAAIGTMLTAEQLLQVADTLTATGAFYRYRMKLDGRLVKLIEALAPIEDLGPLGKTITACIDGRGHVVDHASPDLQQIRDKLTHIEEKVQHEIKRLLRDPQLRNILRFPNATVSGDHYVLPVPANYRQKIAGIVHRTSSTGETVYIEPASVAGLSAERSVLKADEDREVRRILRKLSAEIGKYARQIDAALRVIAQIDLVCAMARYSRDYVMYPPDINEDGRLWLREARHPVLAHLKRNQPAPAEEIPPEADKPDKPIKPKVKTIGGVVPIDVRLGFGFNILVITGPNTGGKTVTLKATGLLSLMALCGMHIPANEGSCVPVFSHILADIGDEQSLEQSLSTFSSHITRISHIFSVADEKSLILLDELGAGTDPTEGAALGRAILDEIDLCRARAMVTTHLGDLKTYAFTNERAENGAVEFDVESLRPTYRLMIGQFGMSNALKIAKRLKLPRELLKRAHRYAKKKSGKTAELARLQQLREDAEKAKVEAMARQHEADRQRETYEQKVTQFEQQKAQENKLNEWRTKLQAGEMVYATKFASMAKVSKVNQAKGTVFVSVGIGQWEVFMNEVFPEAPATNDD